MASMRQPFANPTAMAEAGQRIYEARYKTDFEARHHGKFAAINIRNEDASVGETPEEALEMARKADPGGLFHLIRVGFPSAFSGSSMTRHGHQSKDWVFGC